MFRAQALHQIKELTDWQVGRLRSWLVDKPTGWQGDRLSEWKAGCLTVWQSGKRFGWQIERLSGIRADKLAELFGWQNDRRRVAQANEQTISVGWQIDEHVKQIDKHVSLSLTKWHADKITEYKSERRAVWQVANLARGQVDRLKGYQEDGGWRIGRLTTELSGC